MSCNPLFITKFASISNSYRDLGLDNTLKLIKMENKELKAIDGNEKKKIVKSFRNCLGKYCL